jgi:hypothetical protein
MTDYLANLRSSLSNYKQTLDTLNVIIDELKDLNLSDADNDRLMKQAWFVTQSRISAEPKSYEDFKRDCAGIAPTSLVGLTLPPDSNFNTMEEVKLCGYLTDVAFKPSGKSKDATKEFLERKVNWKSNVVRPDVCFDDSVIDGFQRDFTADLQRVNTDLAGGSGRGGAAGGGGGFATGAGRGSAAREDTSTTLALRPQPDSMDEYEG